MSSAGASILAVGYLLPLAYLLLSLKFGAIASANPWNATGLEWSISVASDQGQLRRVTPDRHRRALRIRDPQEAEDECRARDRTS